MGDRLTRIGARHDAAFVQYTSDVDEAFDEIARIRPAAVAFDSLQIFTSQRTEGRKGSERQTAHIIERAVEWAKATNGIAILLCRVTKAGDYKGTKDLAHECDTFAWLERADRDGQGPDETLPPISADTLLRLRIEKSRFGPPNRAHFRMTGRGLVEVSDKATRPAKTAIKRKAR
jgi:predicted ATP-dependent serine protease